MQRKIGILSGREYFADALIEEINSRNIEGITAEFCTITATKVLEPCPFNVIIDRISHWIEFYRTYLKNAAITGTHVINNPFLFSCDDKFYNSGLATKIGVNVPKTICLPSREYSEDVQTDDLRNLCLPLRWDEIVEYIGFPAILKPYNGYGWRDVYKVNSWEELLLAYDRSGEEVMILQEYIQYEHYVRAFVIGKKHILPIKYDPTTRRYIIDHKHLSDELGARILRDCRKLNEELGYDFNTVEFAIRDGIPYAVDFMNPVPEAKPEVITPEYFRWVVKHLATVAVEFATSSPGTPYQLR